MSNKIKFWTSETYLKEKKDFPKPIKLNIPDWFKQLEHVPGSKTVKGCIPFLETLTTGYVLSLPQDFHLQHNLIVNRERITRFVPSLVEKLNTNVNIERENELHPNGQFLNSPLDKKNLNLPAHKILNPWVIKTPPGYSCLFVPPLNNSDDRFS
jgi:hypothetical protein